MASVADLIVVTGPPGAGKPPLQRRAARHMYQQFARAEVARRHVVDSTEDPTALASRLVQLMQDGLLRRSIRASRPD